MGFGEADDGGCAATLRRRESWQRVRAYRSHYLHAYGFGELDQKALSDTKEMVGKLYGREYVLAEPRLYKTKSKNAQEAHEAIRPTEVSRVPSSLVGILDEQQMKLYTLIWNRTMATQMAMAEIKLYWRGYRCARQVSPLHIPRNQPDRDIRRILRVYFESKDEDQMEKDQASGEGDGEKFLPELFEKKRSAARA